MTVIAGICDGKNVWLGGDSLSADGWHRAWTMREKKVFRVGPLIIGSSGTGRIAQIIRYKVQFEDKPDTDPFQLIAVDFVDAVRDAVKANGAERVIESQSEMPDGAILVGLRGRLFEVHADFQVLESTSTCAAVGCARDIAMGNLYETVGLPEERLWRAMKCAAHLSSGVCPPFTILGSDGTHLELSQEGFDVREGRKSRYGGGAPTPEKPQRPTTVLMAESEG